MGDARPCVQRSSWKRDSIPNYLHIPYDAIYYNDLYCTSDGNYINTYCDVCIREGVPDGMNI